MTLSFRAGVVAVTQMAFFISRLYSISVTILVGGRPSRWDASTAVRPCLIPKASIRMLGFMYFLSGTLL